MKIQFDEISPCDSTCEIHKLRHDLRHLEINLNSTKSLLKHFILYLSLEEFPENEYIIQLLKVEANRLIEVL